MKKVALLLYLLILIGSSTLIYAAPFNNISLHLASETALNIQHKTKEGFSAVSSISTIELFDYQSPKGAFLRLEIEGYSKNFDAAGKPQLPVITKLIEIPNGADAKVVITGYDVEDFFLNDIANELRIGPVQPSVSKNIPSEMVEFIYDAEAYGSDTFNILSPVTFEIVGTTRGFSFGKLKISPFRYNPVKNKLQVLNNISFDVLYDNDQISFKADIKQKKYSSAFNRAIAPIVKLSDTVSARKDALTAGDEGPLTYVIVAHSSFRGNSKLNEFIEWKRQSGFVVIDVYTDDPSVGSSKESIRGYLENLYNTSNSPSYALFIGDVDKVPAWDGKTGSHVTDLYYFTYDGSSDYIPDVYYGRFPADDNTELDAIITKTLQYETFQFVSTEASDYLDNYMFIAGDDPGYAASYGNAQVNYAVAEYFPTIYKYLYTEDRPSLANEIKYNFNIGMGFVNYTGHCDALGWYNYALGNYYFAASDLLNMQNKEKYGFVIGNCCRSNKFDNDPSASEADCFGEMILKQKDGGAIGYIGAANDTFWDEDFYWSVGKSSLAMEEENAGNHTSENTHAAVYDGLFYTGNDEREFYATAGQVVYRGNLSVTEAGSHEDQYYWEIYNLMGDPSLTPYLSEPDSKNGPGGDPATGQTGANESKSICFIGTACDIW